MNRFQAPTEKKETSERYHRSFRRGFRCKFKDSFQMQVALMSVRIKPGYVIATFGRFIRSTLKRLLEGALAGFRCH